MGEEQRKEVYYTAGDMLWEETEQELSPSSAIFGIQT
jgi:hypothetical protein